jgi:hypothetical protein
MHLLATLLWQDSKASTCKKAIARNRPRIIISIVAHTTNLAWDYLTNADLITGLFQGRHWLCD